MTVGRAGVDDGDAGGGVGQERQGAARLRGQAEVKREAVARAGGYERERSRRADQRLGHFVHRAITADGDHPFAPVRQRGAGQPGGMAGMAGEDEVGIEPVLRNKCPDGGHQPGIAAVLAGAGIENKTRLHAAVMAAGAAARANKCAAMARLASGRARGARAARH